MDARPPIAAALLLAASALMLVPGLRAGVHRADATATATAEGPNVLLIVVDTLRADYLGAWGQQRPTSPRLDALAADGVRFDAFYSSSSWTRPGMASLLTGLHSRTTGVHEEQFDVLPAELFTLPERLREAGWLTLGLTSNPNINALFGFNQGFDEYRDSTILFKFMPSRPGYRRYGPDEGHQMLDASAVTDQGLDLVDRWTPRMIEQPWYLQLLYVDPHFPYQPPGHALEAVGGGVLPEDRYAGEVRYADEQIGRLLDELEARQLLDDTLVIVVSDHGEGLADHPSLPLARTHGHQLYNSVLHVPLILSHPRLDARVDRTLSSSIDLMPTVLDFVGLPRTELPGRSLLAPAERAPAFVIAETDWRYAHKLAVITDAHHYVRNDDAKAYQDHGIHEQRSLVRQEHEMLSNVPFEEIYRRGARQDPSGGVQSEGSVVDRHAKILREWEASHPSRPPQGRSAHDVLVLGDGTELRQGDATEQLDEATRVQLEALGYLGD